MTVPILLRTAGRRVVVVGAGAVAAAKARPFADDGADVVVYAPSAEPGIADDGRMTWHPRAYAGPGDLQGAWLVIAATGVPAVDDAVVTDAESCGIWCVRSGSLVEEAVDEAPGAARTGSATMMAVVRRDPLVLAAGGDGAAPAVTRHVRSELEKRFGAEYGELAALIAGLRRDPAIRSRLARLDDSERKTVWRSLPLVHILGLLREGASDAATELASACLSSSSD